MNEILNITAIFISFCIGSFTAALWMFYALENSNKQTLKELDAKTKLLQKYETKKKV
tara:strand:+ start:771 stop:941 length:171 start_codon:yes stop_codon:yes gene_type:complete